MNCLTFRLLNCYIILNQDYKIYSDQQLLKKLSNSDEHAFDEIYHRYSSSLFKTAYNILKHRTGAEDVVQEIFLALWKRRSALTIKSLGGYLNQSAWYFALRIYKEEKRDSQFYERLAEISEEISKEDPALFKDLQNILQKTISQLPHDHQAIFKLSRESNMTYREIAEHLNISVKTVEKKMSDSLKHIRFEMGNLILVLGILLIT